MSITKKDINCRWVVDSGLWDSSTDTYVNKKKVESTRVLTMVVQSIHDSDIITFVDGPTGYESYYVSDLIHRVSSGPEIWICAGTINAYPRCYVKRQDVIDFIEEEKLK